MYLQDRERYKSMILSESIMLVKVSWMSYYQWQAGDTPSGHSKYLKEMKWVKLDGGDGYYADIDENGNFAVVNGYCYGSFQTQRRIPHIEKIEGASRDKKCEIVDEVLVIFCAPNPKRKGKRETNVIGWYVNTKVYRKYQHDDEYDDEYFDWPYNIFSESKNCVLLPESERKDNKVWFLPQVKGSQINFGQSTYKFPKKSAPELQEVLKAMANYDGENWCGTKLKV